VRIAVVLAALIVLLGSAGSATGAGTPNGLATSVSVAAASVTASPFELRMYDPARLAKIEVTTADVVPSSARASRQPGGSGRLYFRLTRQGAMKFHTLTLALARRGARLHHSLPFAVEINSRVRARPLVDYRAFPDGLNGASGVEIGMPLPLAQMLARQIRRGS
jgi:hypothetical protein